MADIVGIGAVVHDQMIIVDEYPPEDVKVSAKEAKVQSGGPCGVALISASKLGVPVKFLGKVGDDISGSIVRTNLSKYGVDISDLKVVPGEQTRACIVISCQKNSTRTCIGTCPGTPGLQQKPEEVNLEAIKEAKFLHIDGRDYNAAFYAAQKAKEFGTKISMDIDNMAATEWDELLRLVDIMVPAERCAVLLTGTKDIDEAARILYDRYHPEMLVVTQGPKGGVLIHDGVLSHYPCFKVDAIDSNGAGDVFHGSLVAALVKGMSPEEAVRFASASSAIKCRHFGASEGAPGYDEVIAFLEEHKDVQ